MKYLPLGLKRLFHPITTYSVPIKILFVNFINKFIIHIYASKYFISDVKVAIKFFFVGKTLTFTL